MVILGEITGAHGVKGEVRVASFTAAPEAIAGYGPLTDEASGRELRLTLRGQVRGQWVARVEGVEDRSAAERLQGTRLCVRRDRLPPPDDGEYYAADLEGLHVEVIEEGARRPLGRVVALHNFGAGDLLEVKGEGGSEWIPFQRGVVEAIDLAAGTLVVRAVPGLFGGAPADAPADEPVDAAEDGR